MKRGSRVVDKKKEKKAGKRKSKDRSSVWERIPGDVLCRILEMAPPKEMYRSRLVCKHWSACWNGHDWAAVLRKQGPWVLFNRMSGKKSRQEVWCPKTGARFDFSTQGGGYVHSFDTSSQGLVLGYFPDHGLYISNPLAPADRKVVPCKFKFEQQQPQLLVEDAAKGIYKLAFATRNSTEVYDSVTGVWESFQTGEEFLSHGLAAKACLLASRAATHHSFTSPSSYMMQLVMIKDTAWKRSDTVFHGLPTDVQQPFRFTVFHPAATGRCIGLALKHHYPANRPFVEVVVYELAEVDDTLVWKRVGGTQLFKDVDWSRCPDIFKVDNFSCLCVENLLFLELARPFSTDIKKYTFRECAVMQPVVFNLEDRTWTYFDHIHDEFNRYVEYIFSPNPLAKP